MHTDKAGILKGDNSGMSGRRASRTDVKGTSFCLQSAKVTLRSELMVMESSSRSCSRLLESLEATEAPTFGYLLHFGAGNGRKRGGKSDSVLTRKNEARTWSHSSKRSLSQAVFEAVQGAAFRVREMCGWPAAQSFGYGFFHQYGSDDARCGS